MRGGPDALVPSFSLHSTRHLDSCHMRLQALFHRVIVARDCRILEGHRSYGRQDELFEEGRTTLRGGDSKHNRTPSEAVDVAPWYPDPPHIHWEEHREFYLFAGFVFGVADELQIPIRWGGDWDGDLTFRDQTFHDLPHFELLL